jgi:hypothetical protein
MLAASCFSTLQTLLEGVDSLLTHRFAANNHHHECRAMKQSHRCHANFGPRVIFGLMLPLGGGRCWTFAANSRMGWHTWLATFDGNGIVTLEIPDDVIILCHPIQYTLWVVGHVAPFANNNISMWAEIDVIRVACTARVLAGGINHGTICCSSSSCSSSSVGRNYPSWWGCSRDDGPEAIPHRNHCCRIDVGCELVAPIHHLPVHRFHRRRSNVLNTSWCPSTVDHVLT